MNRQDQKVGTALRGLVTASLVACGDPSTTSGAGSTGATVTTDATTTSSTTSSTTPTTTAPTTDGSGTAGMTEGMTTAMTSTSSATATSTSTDATTTTGTTGMVSSSTTTDTSISTGMNCACSPDEMNGCQGDQQLVCAADCQGFEPQPCPPGQTCKDGACAAQLCMPGQTTCDGSDAVKSCNANGDGWEPPVQCTNSQECQSGQCEELCDIAQATPSSVGCSFFANKMDNIQVLPDAVIVGNAHPTNTATVQLYFVPNGTNVEQPQGAAVMIQPGQTSTFQLDNTELNRISALRKGGVYRVSSDIPIVAYLHSPYEAKLANDASVLLPEHALRHNHVIASWKDTLNAGYPSYFNVIATQDNTTVKWTPPQSTLAGNGVPAVIANATGQVVMNRFDTLQVRGPQYGSDLSGTYVEADKPIWVVGAVECVNVPAIGVSYCDHIEEQMLPLDYWGKTYVGAHSPRRGNEKHYWRVFGGEDGTTVTTTPAQPGTPFMVDKGKFKDLVIANNTSFVFTGDKPFLPVQYLEGQNGGAGSGDPAMVQMVPVEQFLDRYVFATGTAYNPDYVQVIRQAGGADVLVDGVVVSGYYTVGEYEVADWKIAAGGHLAVSAQPFGIVSVGYTNQTSYAHPGGLKLQIINPQ